MMRCRSSLLLLSLLLIFQTVALAQKRAASKIVVTAPVPAKADEKEIRRLLEAMGIAEQELDAIDPLFETYKQQARTVPQTVWDELKKEIKAEFTAEFIVSEYVAIYARHFTPREIKQMLAFYESPVGKKMVREMKEIQVEAYFVGYERGVKLLEKVREKLKAKGYNMPVA